MGGDKKLKKKLLALVLCFALLGATAALTSCASEEGTAAGGESAAPLTGETINVWNWGEYISNGEDGSLDVNEEFTRRTGIEVNYQVYQTNEELYTMMKMDSSNMDVVIPSDYMIGKMINEGMLEKLNFDNIPNYQYIDPEFKNLEYDPNNEYSVPYTWGTVGIFYNTTMVDPEDVEDLSWDLLWNEKYAGKILMFDNPRDAFAIAQSKLGISMNTTDEEELRLAAEELKKQKPLLQAYVMDQIFDKMASGEAAIAPYYAGDGIIMMEENEDIEFGVPKEGANRFVDAICIPKGTQHKDAAEAYINFLCETDIAVANAETIGYSTPHTEAKSELDPEIVNNPNFYPPEEVLARTEIFLTLPDEVNRLMDDLWIEIKNG